MWGRSPGGGPGNQLQYSCLENPMDRGAWWPTVHWVAKSWTQLNWPNTWIHIERTHHRNHSGTALSLPKYLVVTRGKTVSLQWRIQANDFSAKWSGLPSWPAAHTTSCIPRYNVIRTRDHISAASFPVLHWHLIMKKHQICPNRRTCYKMIDWSQGHKREEKTRESSKMGRHKGDMMTKYDEILTGSLNREMTSLEKPLQCRKLFSFEICPMDTYNGNINRSEMKIYWHTTIFTVLS